jgi:diguanylate cyclase (GGDEF)-like protein
LLTRVHRLLSRLTPRALVACATATLALVGLLDYLTGNQISFAPFYFVPIAAAAWYAGRAPGYVFASAASVVWYAVELAGGYPYDSPLIPVWNAFARLVSFLIIAALLGRLRDRLEIERRLATTDGLTGVLNSRAFTAQLGRDLALCGRSRTPLALAYLDLDDFKQINDRFGHTEGDRLLQSVGRTLSDGLRRTDTVARLGGDEFALILPGTDLAGAQTVVAGLRRRIVDANPTDLPPVRFSIGAIVLGNAEVDVKEAIAAADRLMYAAKARGKNFAICETYRPPVEPPVCADRGAAL